MPVNAMGDGGIDNPDAVGLHLGDGHMNQIQGPLTSGSRGDGFVNGAVFCLVIQGEPYKNEIAVLQARRFLSTADGNGQNP